MAQKMNRLTWKAIGFAKAGLFADGGGLYLAVSPTGAKRWVFVYRRGAKRTEMGLGSFRKVSLARARELAQRDVGLEGLELAVEARGEDRHLLAERRRRRGLPVRAG